MEPTWLTKRREQAAKDFAQLSIPIQDELWRRTDWTQVHVERFAPLPPAQNGAAPGSASARLPVALSVAGEISCGETLFQPTLEATCAAQGVQLLSLADAFEKNNDLVSKYLGRGFQGRHEKFLSQNEAYWQTGVLCHIPAGVTVEAPLLIGSYFHTAETAAFPRLLVVLEKGAKATLVHYTSSKLNQEASFLNGVCEVYLEEGADLTWVELQLLGSRTYEVALKRAELKRDSRLQWIFDIQGAKLSKTHIETILKGEGARADVLGLLLGSDQQHLELCSLTQHVAPHTSADILIKGTAKDQAKTIFQGMIRIEKSAQQTQSYMANHNLVLGKKAHADSIPRLEIEADDVKASHGATIGQVDAEQLFYLKTRGLDAATAERLLVQGFYEEIFGRIPLESIREMMRKNLQSKGM